MFQDACDHSLPRDPWRPVFRCDVMLLGRMECFYSLVWSNYLAALEEVCPESRFAGPNRRFSPGLRHFSPRFPSSVRFHLWSIILSVSYDHDGVIFLDTDGLPVELPRLSIHCPPRIFSHLRSKSMVILGPRPYGRILSIRFLANKVLPLTIR